MQILNSTNGVVANYSYDAWGNLLEVTDASGSAITSTTSFANINPIRYRGYYYDSETGFYYLKSRYYDPQNCRFVSADTRIDLNCGSTNLNLFAYCGNDPVNNVDPNGTSAAAIYSGIEGIRDWLGSNSTGDPYIDAAMKVGAFVLGAVTTVATVGVWAYNSFAKSKVEAKSEVKEKDKTASPSVTFQKYYHITTLENAMIIRSTGIMKGRASEGGYVYVWRLKSNKYAKEHSGARFEEVVISFIITAAFEG